MKLKVALIFAFFLSEKSIAQFTVVQPEVFSLTNSLNTPCPVSDRGKIFYDINTNVFKYCTDASISKTPFFYWQGSTDIYYMGKVGINNGTPSYDLDLMATAKVNTLIVDGNVGFNTDTPNEKLEIVNRNIVIKSTADANFWTLTNSVAGARFEFSEKGFDSRMYINYGGNIGIGYTTNNLDKLRVTGNVSYAGNVSIEGKGILANTNANQLIMYSITSAPIGNNFYVENNTCKTSSFGLGNSVFTQAPVVVLGQKNAGNFSEEKLVMSVENVTSTGGVIKHCNNSGGTINLGGNSYSLIAIGVQ